MRESKEARKTKQGAGFKRKIPDLSRDLAVGEDGDAPFRMPDISLRDRMVNELKLDVLEGRTLRIENCILNRVALSGSMFTSAKLKDVRMVECDLANVKMLGLHAIRVEFIDCRMTGLQAGEAKCQDILVRNGDQRYSQFRFSNFQTAEFDACNFDDADFYGADLSGCIFQRCSLRNGEMSGVNLEGADLRGSSVEGLRLNAQDIFGATVDASQALVFASLLGIRIA